jgi:hypothetical protein
MVAASASPSASQAPNAVARASWTPCSAAPSDRGEIGPGRARGAGDDPAVGDPGEPLVEHRQVVAGVVQDGMQPGGETGVVERLQHLDVQVAAGLKPPEHLHQDVPDDHRGVALLAGVEARLARDDPVAAGQPADAGRVAREGVQQGPHGHR